MQAAQAAGMRPIAVEWGYHHPESGGPTSWQAAAIIRHPLELIEHL
jgi:phosphoglycolate phosphatase-like HAD superfamily hydrolase